MNYILKKQKLLLVLSVYKKICVLGAGSWGTAIASILAENAYDVTLWSRSDEIVTSINERHINNKYFPNHTLAHNITATTDMKQALNADIIFLVVPTKHLISLLQEYKDYLHAPLVICNKGIDTQNLLFPSQYIKNITNNEFAILSGPNFAIEIMNKLPAATIIASKAQELTDNLAHMLSNDYFKCYTTTDVTGVEICGSMKNVLAIACGICQGKQLGENAKSYLITKGLEEIKLLIKTLKGDVKTIFTVAGIGDIILTCNSTLSRNLSFGISLATKQNNLKEQTVEGFYTAKAINIIAAQYNLKLPIMNAVYKIIHENCDIDSCIAELLKK
jgi:glycerol-3-phosphate dehydrogenase (NAD(P)+)